jgi:uncharacterized protein YqeY
MLMENIKKDMMSAKKDKDTLKANLLSTLYSEIFTLSKSGKPMTEEDSVKVIKKFIKNADDTLALDIPAESKEKYRKEKEILESYLPKQLSKEEIDNHVTRMLSEGKQMKDIMQYFKENYSGMYDGRAVNEAVKSKQS